MENQPKKLTASEQMREMLPCCPMEKAIMDNPSALKIKSGDTVYHQPSRERWVVAYADYGRNELAWLGWPPGTAKISDCELKYSCSEEEENKVINDLANMRGDRASYDHRKSWALSMLKERSRDESKYLR